MKQQFFARKKIEVFLGQRYIQSKISYLKLFFVIANIIDKKYVFCITDYSLNNIFDPIVINIVMSISIETLHFEIDQLNYHNILGFLKVKNGNNAKIFITE